MIFEHKSQASNLSKTRPVFTRAKSDAVWTSGFSVSNLSIAIFFITSE